MVKVLTNLSQIATLEGAYLKDGRRLEPEDLSIIDEASVVYDEKKILWVGKTSELPTQYAALPSMSLKNHVLTPELVDSHTHLVFGGDRAQEYAQRLNGVPYEEIARQGGGILFTMRETNAARPEELYQSAKLRVENLFSYGVGTIEVKSGYALDFDGEYQLSLLIKRLKDEFAPRVQIFNTFLAAHDVPRNFASSSRYLNDVVLPLLEKLVPLQVIDAVDIFHEKNYFSAEDTERLFARAKELGIPRKIHADELNDNGGAALAVKYGALSADHLLKVSKSGIEQLAGSTTVATILPGTAFFLGKPLAPVRAMAQAGVKLALASDYNPGSCHCDNLLLIAAISAPQLKLNQAEVWAGITLNAAHALGLKQQGALLPGLRPRFSLFKSKTLSQLTYHWGKNFAVTSP